MTIGSLLYLIMSILMFGAFSGTLAYYSRQPTRATERRSTQPTMAPAMAAEEAGAVIL